MKNIPELDAVFNTAPMDDNRLELVIPPSNPGLNLDQQDDYDLARNTLRQVIAKGQNTLDDIIELSRNSEHPRNYEVAGQIMKTLSDTAKDLLELQKRAKDLKNTETSSKASIGTQNNVVFAGSTAELMKMLKNNT
jgi:Tfp pilus assembly protein PilF